ncbi:hypothetical protein [Mycobacterium avium]|uniref:hypothetical protein n=1 Tax=Mycobacterium avium TaxID=1764 RepID=UPI0013051C93|nr:hypothetical protein [Mycobacterium avium]QWY64945.1 hypothetical protein BJP78_24865 [Mycobacterium avium subsp. hominissuis]QXD08194.1 hypothetical protein BB735_012025 [Mycobacterium avium subsp. hominissuis]
MSASTSPGCAGSGRCAGTRASQLGQRGCPQQLGVDATITIDHCDNEEKAAAT